MNSSLPVLPVGTAVASRHRWPYDSAHPDCWAPPHKGVILAKDDPRAWFDTIAYPSSRYPDGPNQAEVSTWVNQCLAEGWLVGRVPVLWTCSMTGQKFVQWEDCEKLAHYYDGLNHWKGERHERLRARG